jgi:hypothetical protein
LLFAGVSAIQLVVVVLACKVGGRLDFALTCSKFTTVACWAAVMFAMC